jgi:hypothetical protein
VSKYYPILSDKKFLLREYLEKSKSTVQIAKENGIKSSNSVRQALVSHGIKTRGYREAQIITRETPHIFLDKAVIDGNLLGDAGLRSFKKGSIFCAPYFYKSNKFYSHVLWVANQFLYEGAEQHIKEKRSTLKGKEYVYPYFKTASLDDLKDYYRRWYPKKNPYGGLNYEKVIPDDVDISPFSLLNCFLDDGNTYQRRKESKIKQVCTTLCLEGFYPENLEKFVSKVRKEYKISISVRRYHQGKGARVFINQSSYKDFLEIIGICPKELKADLGYKWK